MTSLYDPLLVGDIALANRIVMAPLTRNRAGAGKVDARHHRKLAHHRPLAGDRQAILVVERRHRHTDCHVAFRQLALVNILHCRAVTGVILLDQNSLEHVSAP